MIIQLLRGILRDLEACRFPVQKGWRRVFSFSVSSFADPVSPRDDAEVVFVDGSLCSDCSDSCDVSPVKPSFPSVDGSAAMPLCFELDSANGGFAESSADVSHLKSCGILTSSFNMARRKAILSKVV